MTTAEAVAEAIDDTFGASTLELASAASGISPSELRSSLDGDRPFTLTELHRIAIATGRRTTDFLGGA